MPRPSSPTAIHYGPDQPRLANGDQIRVVLIMRSNMKRQLLTEALNRYGGFKVDGCDGDWSRGLETISSGDFDVAVIEMESFPDGRSSGFAALRRIHTDRPKVRMVLVIKSCDRDLVVSAFRSGMRGIFCESTSSFEALCKCIAAVREGQVWANSEQMEYIVEELGCLPSVHIANAKGLALLTNREGQVARLVAEGLTNSAIARELNLSEQTVKKYISRMFDKLGVSNRTELVLYVVAHGKPVTATTPARAAAAL